MIWYWDFFYGCIRTLIEMCFFMFRRSRTKVRKKTKYTILDNMDEQEKMELRPKYSKCLIFQSTFQTFPVFGDPAMIYPVCPHLRHQTQEHRAQLQPHDVRVRAGQWSGHHLQPRPTGPEQKPDQCSGCPQREHLRMSRNAQNWGGYCTIWVKPTLGIMAGVHSVCLFSVSSSIQILVSTRCVLSMTFIGQLSTREMWKSKGRRQLELGIPGFWELTVALSLHAYRLFE